MPRGGNDFGSIGAVFAANQMDTAEIQHILSGFGLIDGLGRTVYIDNFRFGIGAWIKGNFVGGDKPRIVDRNAVDSGVIFVSPYVVLLEGNNTVDGESQLSKVFYIGNQIKFGLEVGCLLASGSGDLHMRIAYTDLAGIANNAVLRVSSKDGIIYIQDNTGFVNVGTFDKPTGTTFFNIQIKLVADWITQKYTKVLFGDIPYNVSTKELKDAVAGIKGTVNFTISVKSLGAGNTNLYLGMVRCTKDEP